MNSSAVSYNSNFAIALRKSKRNLFINKKRLENLNDYEDYCLYIGDLPPHLLTLFPVLSSSNSELSKLQTLKNLLETKEISEELFLEILKILGKSLRCESIFPRKIFLEIGLFQTLIQIVKKNDNEEIVSQSLNCLCNIAASKDEFSEEILKTGVLLKLLEWVKKGGINVKENGIWTLANMIGGCKELTETLLEQDYLNLLVEVPIENQEIAEGITLSLSNLTKDLSKIKQNHVEIILTICEKIKESGNFSYLWTLSNLTKGEDWILDRIILKSLAEFPFKGILNDCTEVNHPSALILCNLAGGSQKHCEFLLNHRIFDVVLEVFHKAEDELLFLVYNLMRNVIVDNLEAVELLKKSMFLKVCIDGLSGRIMKVQKEACCFLLNFSHKFTIEDEDFINKVLEYLCNCLENLDTDIVQSSLNTIFNILTLNSSKFLPICESLGLLTLIQDLESHPNDLISSSSSYLTTEFL